MNLSLKDQGGYHASYFIKVAALCFKVEQETKRCAHSEPWGAPGQRLFYLLPPFSRLRPDKLRNMSFDEQISSHFSTSF